jgi:undecaprenyl-diphosphatase
MTNPFFDVLFPAITDLHKTYVFQVVFVPLVFLFWLFLYSLRGAVMFLLMLITLGISDMCGAFVKRFWQRPRPFSVETEFIQRSAAGGFSFPSNHALNMFCAAFFLSTLFPKYRILFFVFATLVALSRVYNGVHYPSDVIGGALIGSIFGVIGGKVTLQIKERMEKGLKKKKRKKEHA